MTSAAEAIMPAEHGPIRLKIRVAETHPRVTEAMRIVARILLRNARQMTVDLGSSLSLHVEPRGDESAPEN